MKNENQIKDMIRNNKPLFESLCRICLIGDGVCSVFEIQKNISLSEKITLCTSVTIEQRDGLPCKICEECMKALYLADEFRTKCLYTDSLLKKAILEDDNEDIPTAPESGSKTAILDDFVSSPASNEIKQEFSFTEDTPLEYLNEEFMSRKHATTKKIITEKYDFKILKNCDQKDLNDGRYSCNQCNEEFPKKSKLNSHLKKIHGVKRKYAGKEKKEGNYFDEAGNIDDNNLNLVPNKDLKLECENSKSKVYKEVFMGRIIGQGKDRQYQCVECDYVTQIRKSLIFHTRKHTGERPHVCDICNRAFILPSSLIYHKKTHNEKNFTCPTCAKQFYCKQHYIRHLTVHTQEKKAICTICNKALKSKITLQVHMNRHNNIKNYSCETCGATFVTVSELIGHSKIHTGEKKFACNICNFKSYKKTGLERHLKYHSGEKTFQCDHCEKICCTRGELKCHMRKHTKEKNYPCTVCEQKFVHSSSLNTHMLRVHQIKFKWRDIIDRRIVK